MTIPYDALLVRGGEVGWSSRQRASKARVTRCMVKSGTVLIFNPCPSIPPRLAFAPDKCLRVWIIDLNSQGLLSSEASAQEAHCAFGRLSVRSRNLSICISGDQLENSK